MLLEPVAVVVARLHQLAQEVEGSGEDNLDLG